MSWDLLDSSLPEADDLWLCERSQLGRKRKNGRYSGGMAANRDKMNTDKIALKNTALVFLGNMVDFFTAHIKQDNIPSNLKWIHS